MLLSIWGGGGVHWAQVVRGAGSLALSLGVFRPFLPAFCPFAAFALVALLANMALFRVLRGFDGVLGISCGFVWVGCFAWLVGLLCA